MKVQAKEIRKSIMIPIKKITAASRAQMVFFKLMCWRKTMMVVVFACYVTSILLLERS